MATKYTIMNALAYVAITGRMKYLPIRTRIDLTSELVGFQCQDLNKPFHFLTEAGERLARQSRMWKAHQHLTEMGFKVRATDGHRPRYISYEHKDDPERWAFTGGHGRVYANPEGKRMSAEYICQFKNGADQCAS